MIEVCCAVIENERAEILATQRSEFMTLPFKWEFPGGKIETGESPEQALMREIGEELGVYISIVGKLQPVVHRYTNITVKLIPFLCVIKSGKISLKEHLRCGWYPPQLLRDLDWAEADLPIAEEVISLKTKL